MTMLHEIQRKTELIIHEIERTYNGRRHDAPLTVIHLMEEMGELARQLYNQETKREAVNRENLGEELADCLMLLCHLASLHDIELETEFEKKFGVLKTRFRA